MKSNSIAFTSSRFTVIAGPCAVESDDQFLKTARFVKKNGAHMLRAGIFKPRTSPHSFQGLGKAALPLLKKIKDQFGIPIVSEVIDHNDIPVIYDYVDVFQVGARNCHNTVLLKALGKIKKPILLKRGYMTTIDEWLLSAEYILSAGNSNVILCERGIRTFENATRYTLDLSAIPVLKSKTTLPVIVDPSHAIGYSKYIPKMCYAACAAGADGLMIETHPNPKHAKSDSSQALSFSEFATIMKNLKKYAALSKKTI